MHQYIEQYHVSGISGQILTEEAIRAMIEALDDPYTEYFTKEQYEAFSNRSTAITSGSACGCRRMTLDSSRWKCSPILQRNALAFKRGIIFRASTETTRFIGISTVLWSKSAEPEGSSVELVIERFGELMTLNIIRAPVQVPIVYSAWLEHERIGYIQFTTFSQAAEEQFAAELERMKENDIQGLIVDLRGNRGGYLHVAETMAKHFIEQGPAHLCSRSKPQADSVFISAMANRRNTGRIAGQRGERQRFGSAGGVAAEITGSDLDRYAHLWQG